MKIILAMIVILGLTGAAHAAEDAITELAAQIPEPQLRTVNLAVSAANAVEPVKYPVCQQTTEAIIDARCVNFAEVVLNDDTKAAEVACADTIASGSNIQQCIMRVEAILSDNIDAKEKRKAEAVACSGGSDLSAIQECIQRAKVVLERNNDTEAGITMASAISCSGNTDRNNIQRCLSSAQVVAEGSPRDINLAAAFACSGNIAPGSVQSCVSNGGFEIKEKSRFQLIQDLISAK